MQVTPPLSASFPSPSPQPAQGIAADGAIQAVAEEIRVQGIVQGVGFRPTVYRLAQDCHLSGEVCNDGQGVLIRAVAPIDQLDLFVQRLQQECPPLARIESILRQPLPQATHYTDFSITHSISTTIRTGITPDAATCPQCKAETFDPASRWYRYPFTNCTHCGPRLSIVKAIPYDRANTSMASFALCADCAQQYADVTDRRFHAQPVACPQCGPEVWLERSDGKPIEQETALDDIDAVCRLLQQGEIVAIKGIGGFHLACDATNEATVQELRQRKHRYHKPFALMARDLEVIGRYCVLNDQERSLLQSPMAPIVLLKKQNAASQTPQNLKLKTQNFLIAPSVAPGINQLGFMLPYTPLQHLLLQQIDRPIVFTSGNVSDEPQCIDNDEARQKLANIADYFLLHNREIVNRVDDSLVRVINRGEEQTGTKIETEKTSNIQVLRRARGYAPAPIYLPAGFAQAVPILAMGSELKNTFCLLQEGKAIVSQHLGDLENAAAFQAYRQTLDLYLHLFEHQPAVIAVDQHPEYLSTKLGQEFAALVSENNRTLTVQKVQHHHAHIAACMVENDISLETPTVMGIALDGLGYGEDGTLWGGEFLLADYWSFQRLAQFKPVAMLGGEQAIYQPWRNTYAHLMSAFSWEALQKYAELDLYQFLAKQPRSLLDQMLAKGINSPVASSAGRLFDAVAAAVGICREQATYEGQGAIELEALIDAEHLQQASHSGYSFEVKGEHLLYLEPRLMWQSLLNDLLQGVPTPLIAARFHVGLADAIVRVVSLLNQRFPFTQVALTGGVFQNQILLQQVNQRLKHQGFTVLTHSQIPANDGGLSLGQATIAAARTLDKTKHNLK